MEAIILAGGRGTRLASRLNGIPKPMASVAGRPFLELLLDELQRSGVTRVLLSVGHLRHVIIDHFGAMYRDIHIEYVVEEQPLGTGGAIRLALARAHTPQVFVVNGDTFLQLDYAAMLAAHTRDSATLTMASAHLQDIGRYGGLVTDHTGRIVAFSEKGTTGPGRINAGVYVLNRDVSWFGLPDAFSFETDFLMPHLNDIAPRAYPTDGLFLDIGIPEDLDQAQTLLA